jgi:hypothetical protein
MQDKENHGRHRTKELHARGGASIAIFSYSPAVPPTIGRYLVHQDTVHGPSREQGLWISTLRICRLKVLQ